MIAVSAQPRPRKTNPVPTTCSPNRAMVEKAVRENSQVGRQRAFFQIATDATI